MTSIPIKTATAGLLGLALTAAGCGWNAHGPSQAQLVQWAQCLRAHGVPGFPDPDRSGAFDSSRFDDSTPAFKTASAGVPVRAAAGRGRRRPRTPGVSAERVATFPVAMIDRDFLRYQPWQFHWLAVSSLAVVVGVFGPWLAVAGGGGLQ